MSSLTPTGSDPRSCAPPRFACTAEDPPATPTPQADPAPDAGSDSGTDSGARQATATKPRPAPPKLDHLPPFKVLLHNDDHNTFEWVTESIIELTPHRKESAMMLTWEAHATGVSLLLVTHKERAELYQDQFKTKRLTVTIEPAD